MDWRFLRLSVRRDERRERDWTLVVDFERLPPMAISSSSGGAMGPLYQQCLLEIQLCSFRDKTHTHHVHLVCRSCQLRPNRVPRAQLTIPPRVMTHSVERPLGRRTRGIAHVGFDIPQFLTRHTVERVHGRPSARRSAASAFTCKRRVRRQEDRVMQRRGRAAGRVMRIQVIPHQAGCRRRHGQMRMPLCLRRKVGPHGTAAP